MMETAHMGTGRLGTGRPPRPLVQSELVLRMARARQRMIEVRAEFHHACQEVEAAERLVMARRVEREEAALRLARLADVLETLDRSLALEREACGTAMPLGRQADRQHVAAVPGRDPGERAHSAGLVGIM